MKYFLLVSVVFLAGCVITPRFNPKTVVGAKCKHECATAISSCYGSPYTCDRGHAKCVQACIELEHFQAQK